MERKAQIRTITDLRKELPEQVSQAVQALLDERTAQERKIDNLAKTLTQYQSKQRELNEQIGSLKRDWGKALEEGKDLYSVEEAISSKAQELKALEERVEELEDIIAHNQSSLEALEIKVRDAFIEALVAVRPAWDLVMDYHGRAMADLFAAWDQTKREVGEKLRVKISWGTMSEDLIGKPTYSAETHERLAIIYR